MLKRLRNLFFKIYNNSIRSFKVCKSPISWDVKVTNPKHITIEKGVSIGKLTWLYAILGDNCNNVFTPDIQIKFGVKIGRFCHITCSKQVVLEKNVFVTERVLITDSIHGYKDINTPVYYQPLISKTGVHIGEGTWIGNGASIVGNVTIGKGCVIATNTVISNTIIPDYCVVVGIPGKIVKQYNIATGTWDNL